MTLPGDIGTYRIIRPTVRDAYLAELRAAGRGAVRRRLEALVNAGVIGVAGAQQVYHDAFGDRLIAVKAPKPSRLRAWLGRMVAHV